MTRPEAVRRVKSYSAATGYVYQYYFYEVNKARRGSASGNEYVYMVSEDRRKVFPLRILVRQDAVERWLEFYSVFWTSLAKLNRELISI